MEVSVTVTEYGVVTDGPAFGFDIVDGLKDVAERKNASVAQIALAWLLHKKGVTSVIIGARKEDQLIDNLKSVDIELNDEDMEQLDKVSAKAPEYPNWMAPMDRGEDPFSRFSS